MKRDSKTSTLSDVAAKVLKQQAKEIAKLGESWKPTEENLTKVVLAVQDAERQQRKIVQKEGIEKARKSGIKLGRPKIVQPNNFPKVYGLFRRGDISRREASKLLEISIATFDRWCEELDKKQER